MHMKTHKLYTLLVLTCVLSLKNRAQETMNSGNVEQTSFQLYNDKKWPELINYGKEAEKKGFSYFYLQIRIGIAYYEQKNYALAEGHFKKALQYNSDDELTLEYLYYCYIYMGRNEEARRLSKTFKVALLDKIGIKDQSHLGFVMIEGGTKITDKKNYFDENFKTYSNFFNPAVYMQVGLNHYIKNRFSLFHAATLFNQTTFINKIAQKQYFIKASIPIKSNWSISPSVHYVHTKTITEIKTLPNQSPGGSPLRPRTIVNTNKSNYLIGSITLQKTIRKYVFGVGTTVSNMNNITQYIHSGFISYAPLGNSKLVVGVASYVHTTDNYSTSNLAVAPFLYLQPTKRLSLKLSYLYNSKTNFIEDNGYLVNNSSDLTKSRYSALLNFTLSKHVSLYGLYQLEYKQENIQKFNYQYNVIVGGIKITP